MRIVRKGLIKPNLTRGLLINLAVLTGVCGCGAQSISSDTRVSAQQAYDSGVQAFADGQMETARQQFASAIAQGGLDVDQLTDAQLKLAMSLATNGEFEQAEAALKIAAQGPVDEAQMHIAQGFILACKGDEAGADAEYRAARKLDPAAKPIPQPNP